MNKVIKIAHITGITYAFGFTPAWFFNSPQNSLANFLAPSAAAPAFSPAYV